MERVMAAVDGSPLAMHAAVEAARLCRATGAQLMLLHVAMELTTVPAADLGPVIPAETPLLLRDEEGAQRVLDDAAVAVRAEGIEPAMTLRWVAPHASIADEIVRSAAAEGCDLIVLGPRGRANILRFLLGSVTATVIRHAECSVLVVRATGSISQPGQPLDGRA